MKINFSRKFGIISLILIVIFLSGCERMREGREGQDEAERLVPVFAVNTTPAIQGPIQDHLALSGDVVSGSMVDAFSDTAGRVAAVHVSLGQWVNIGDPIMAIDPSRPGMTFLHSTVTAPISGTIVTLPAQVGMMISPAIPLARVSGGGRLEVRLFVAERFISRMALNLPVEVTLDAWPGEVFQGRISEISPTVDQASRTLEVRVAVYNTGSRMMPGMFARARIVTERRENIVKIPSTAVVSRFGEQFVYVVEPDPENPEFNIARRRDITPGILIDGVLEIQSGLAAGEEIVARGQTLLEDGVRVNIIDRVTPLGTN